jgi:hypothetical protein
MYHHLRHPSPTNSFFVFNGMASIDTIMNSNCGKSFCEKCSAKNVPIPHYGFVEPVRVCDSCHVSIQKSVSNPTPAPAAATSTAATTPTTRSSTSPATAEAEAQPPSARQAAAAARARSDSNEEVKAEAPSTVAVVAAPPQKKVSKCVCDMPLCICPPDKEEKKAEEKKAEAPKPVAKVTAKAAPASTAPSTFGSFGFGQAKAAPTYDLKGDLNEQCRDAIKAKDHAGVVTLLSAKADARFIDRTGNSLVHLVHILLPSFMLTCCHYGMIWWCAVSMLTGSNV